MKTINIELKDIIKTLYPSLEKMAIEKRDAVLLDVVKTAAGEIRDRFNDEKIKVEIIKNVDGYTIISHGTAACEREAETNAYKETANMIERLFDASIRKENAK